MVTRIATAALACLVAVSPPGGQGEWVDVGGGVIEESEIVIACTVDVDEVIEEVAVPVEEAPAADETDSEQISVQLTVDIIRLAAEGEPLNVNPAASAEDLKEFVETSGKVQRRTQALLTLTNDVPSEWHQGRVESVQDGVTITSSPAFGRGNPDSGRFASRPQVSNNYIRDSSGLIVAFSLRDSEGVFMLKGRFEESWYSSKKFSLDEEGNEGERPEKQTVSYTGEIPIEMGKLSVFFAEKTQEPSGETATVILVMPRIPQISGE